MAMRLFAATLGLTMLAGLASACVSAPRRFDGEIVWRVNDRHPIPKPEKRWASKYWDGADNTFFRPFSHAFLLNRSNPAQNVNALGGVPNSSWYTNRLSRWSVSPQRVARGPCERERMPRGDRWIVVGGALAEQNRRIRVVIEEEGRRSEVYRLKFDGREQTVRSTAAEVLASRIFWAGGFETRCNRIVYFDPDHLAIDRTAKFKDGLGQGRPITRGTLRKVMKFAPRDDDGRVRAAAADQLPGERLGPFSYFGTREDDLNDVIRHENRRELRGSRLLAAWINHFDSRTHNTATTFIRQEGGKRGYVQHFLIGFTDSLGAQWRFEEANRRFGHSWYLDFGDITADFLSLGIIERPWNAATEQSEAPIFGYFGVEGFDPADWKAGYRNPAFVQMDERDAFWATNIISKFSVEHIEAIVDEARFENDLFDRFLRRVLVGRRDRIVETYFKQLSPLVKPRVRERQLCVTDAWVARDYGPAEAAFYDYRFSRRGERRQPWLDLERESSPDGEVCVELPSYETWTRRRGDLVVQMRVRRADQRSEALPVRFFLRPTSRESFRTVGILRSGNAP